MRAFLQSSCVRPAESRSARFLLTSRRPLCTLKVLACATTLLIHVGAMTDAVQARHILENARLRIEVEPNSGAISCIRDKQGKIDLVAVDSLADVFRLVVRDAENKNHVVLGRAQRLSSATQKASTLNLAWVDPLVDTEGVSHHIHVRMEIRLDEQMLEFQLFVDNAT